MEWRKSHSIYDPAHCIMEQPSAFLLPYFLSAFFLIHNFNLKARYKE